MISIAIVMLLIAVAQNISTSMSLNDDQFIYALDDAYIHMSIAENFAEHGVWGVTQHGFTSATSSPLWTGLLAVIYSIIGVSDSVSLILNIIFAGLMLIVADRILYKSAVPNVYRLLVLIGIIILLPLNTLILMGMEHVLQILLVLLFMDTASRLAADDSSKALIPRPLLPNGKLVCTENGEKSPLSQRSVRERGFRGEGKLIILGALVTSVRYEGLCLVLIFFLFLAIRRRWRFALTLGGVSLLPIVIYGLVAMNNGWDFLPTSLMLKSDASSTLFGADLHEIRLYFVDDLWKAFNGEQVLFAPTIALLIVYAWRYEQTRRVWDVHLLRIVAFIGMTLFTVRMVTYADEGTFFRYEAYLVAVWLVVIISAIGEHLPRRFQRDQLVRYAVMSAVIVLVMQGIWTRYQFLAYERPVVTATENIYHQQVQMARFLATYYPDATVGVNDIGAVSYLTDVQIVDLYGLGTLEVAHAKQHDHYDTAFIQQLAQDTGMQLAIIYTPWLDAYGGVPETWHWAGQWEVTNNVILGYHQVNFYAMHFDDIADLQNNLRDYADTLPDTIIQRGY